MQTLEIYKLDTTRVPYPTAAVLSNERPALGLFIKYIVRALFSLCASQVDRRREHSIHKHSHADSSTLSKLWSEILSTVFCCSQELVRQHWVTANLSCSCWQSKHLYVGFVFAIALAGKENSSSKYKFCICNSVYLGKQIAVLVCFLRFVLRLSVVFLCVFVLCVCLFFVVVFCLFLLLLFFFRGLSFLLLLLFVVCFSCFLVGGGGGVFSLLLFFHAFLFLFPSWNDHMQLIIKALQSNETFSVKGRWLWGPYSRTMAPWSALTIVLFTLHHTPPTQTLSLRPQRCPSECSCQPDTNPAHAPGLMVNCSGRELLQIPEDVPAEATTLLLSGNQLARVPDDVFSHLQELRELDLSANFIASLQRNAFRGLGNLKELNLFRNKLVFGPRAYPDDVFLPLASLTSLRLSSNVWHSWDSESLRPANTKSSQPQTSPVKADGNLLFVSSDIQSHFVDHGFAEASEGFRDSPVTRFSRTTRVSVGNSPVSSRYGGVGYPDRALSQLHNLRYLSLDGLANKTLGPGFRNLTHLTDLDITGGLGFCQLATLKRDTFANVPSVRHLNLSNCNIIDVTQDAFSALVALETLDLSFNVALGFDLLGEALLGLSETSLQTLIIDAIVPSRAQGLSITSKQLRFFGNLTRLESLQARFNRIRGFDDGALCVGMPPKLKYVNVNGNLFELAPYVNDVGCLGSLQHLDMNGFDGYWVPPLRPPDREALGQNLHMQLAKSSVARGNGEPTLAENTKQGVVVQPCVGKYFSFPPNLETFNVEDFGLLYKLEKVKIDPNNRLKRIDASRKSFSISKRSFVRIRERGRIIPLWDNDRLRRQRLFQQLYFLGNPWPQQQQSCGGFPTRQKRRASARSQVLEKVRPVGQQHRTPTSGHHPSSWTPGSVRHFHQRHWYFLSGLVSQDGAKAPGHFQKPNAHHPQSSPRQLGSDGKNAYRHGQHGLQPDRLRVQKHRLLEVDARQRSVLRHARELLLPFRRCLWGANERHHEHHRRTGAHVRKLRGGLRGSLGLDPAGGAAAGSGPGLPLPVEAALPLLRLATRSPASETTREAAGGVPLRRLRVLRLRGRRLRQRGAEAPPGGGVWSEAVHPHQGLCARYVRVSSAG